MSNIRLAVQYLVSVSLIPLGILGLFHSYYYKSLDGDFSFYLKISSLFLAVTFLFVCWYYANLLIKSKVLNKLDGFGLNVSQINHQKISEQKLSDKFKCLLDYLALYEKYNFELLGFAVPLFLVFISEVILAIVLNRYVVPSYVIACLIITIVVKFANAVISICDINKLKNRYSSAVNNIIGITKGIQIYNGYNYVAQKIHDKSSKDLRFVRFNLSKSIWKAFAYATLMFLMFCVIYILKLEYFSNALFNISGVEVIFFSSLFVYLAFNVSIFRYMKIKATPEIDITSYTTNDDNASTSKTIDINNLFIAFHGVYFQDPSKFSNTPILSNLSFSVLPGEVIAFTGENTVGISYIFDLLLKFYTPQSGKIYISGNPIDNINTDQIRSTIGCFEEDFSLMQGSILDNLKLLTNDLQKLSEVIEKVGLAENLNDKIRDDNNNILVSQEALFRLQIARLFIQKPKIVLIKTPSNFESATTEDMFYDLVSSLSKRKTILIQTNNPRTIIYSDKILYINDKEAIFGVHADISTKESYQSHLKNISKNFSNST